MKNKYLMIVLGLSPAVVFNLLILFSSIFEEVAIIFALTTIIVIFLTPGTLWAWERHFTKSFCPQAELGFSVFIWISMFIINITLMVSGCSFY